MSTQKRPKVRRKGTKTNKELNDLMMPQTPQKHMIFKELLEENRNTKLKIRAVESKIEARLEK